MRKIQLKNTKIELKTTQETKELLSKAAILDGMDLSAFMLASAIEKARSILRDHAAITLSAEGQLQPATRLRFRRFPSCN